MLHQFWAQFKSIMSIVLGLFNLSFLDFGADWIYRWYVYVSGLSMPSSSLVYLSLSRYWTHTQHHPISTDRYWIAAHKHHAGTAWHVLLSINSSIVSWTFPHACIYTVHTCLSCPLLLCNNDMKSRKPTLNQDFIAGIPWAGRSTLTGLFVGEHSGSSMGGS